MVRELFQIQLFSSGHYEIIFKKPHWDNADRFIETMDDICSEYKKAPEEDGVFGDVFDGFVKHDYQVFIYEI